MSLRAPLQDKLQNFAFWLMDVAPMDALAVPVLSPLFGFSAITAPEISLEVEEIREGNWPFARKVIKNGSIGTLTLSRGATFFDSDFWRWITASALGDAEALQSAAYGVATALAGQSDIRLRNRASGVGAALGLLGFPRVGGPTVRRDMLLTQFFARSPGTDGILGTTTVGAELLATGGLVAAQSAAAVSLLSGSAPVSLGSTRIPARAWKLQGCIPIRYKVASDFDATSSDVSVMELDIEVEEVEEVSLAGS